jgi:hypothetical protein
MTRERLNQLRELSQLARDHYYAQKAIQEESPASYSRALSLLVMWKQAQQQAEDAVMEWIRQGCMEHIDFGHGKCYINGKESFTIKSVTYKFDPHP